MGREIKRVPVGFDWPLNKTWQGFLLPDWLHEDNCPDCDLGFSARAEHLRNLWYGQAPFRPEDNGSTPLTPETAAVRAFAERNVSRTPQFYGEGEAAIGREARRLADLWNGTWLHHLNQDDVDILVAEGRLKDFTHTWSRETGWVKIHPPVRPTPEQVNEWSIRSLGHDSINAHLVVKATCEREGVPFTCGACDGHGSVEKWAGQRATAEAWERTEPPTGDGWQLWETVSEGSPISPVFATADGLIDWLCSSAYTWGSSRPMQREQAERFVNAGWAPSMVATAETGLVPGEEAVS